MLGAAVSDLLYQALPDATIAGLHDHRMAIVRRKACAAAARKLGLDRLLVVGKGYEGAEPTMAMLAGERCRRHVMSWPESRACPDMSLCPAVPLLLSHLGASDGGCVLSAWTEPQAARGSLLEAALLRWRSAALPCQASLPLALPCRVL